MPVTQLFCFREKDHDAVENEDLEDLEEDIGRQTRLALINNPRAHGALAAVPMYIMVLLVNYSETSLEGPIRAVATNIFVFSSLSALFSVIAGFFFMCPVYMEWNAWMPKFLLICAALLGMVGVALLLGAIMYRSLFG